MDDPLLRELLPDDTPDERLPEDEAGLAELVAGLEAAGRVAAGLLVLAGRAAEFAGLLFVPVGLVAVADGLDVVPVGRAVLVVGLDVEPVGLAVPVAGLVVVPVGRVVPCVAGRVVVPVARVPCVAGRVVVVRVPCVAGRVAPVARVPWVAFVGRVVAASREALPPLAEVAVLAVAAPLVAILPFASRVIAVLLDWPLAAVALLRVAVPRAPVRTPKRSTDDERGPYA